MKADLIQELSPQFNTPEKVQKLLHEMSYNKAPVLQSALSTLKSRKAHCLEGVFVAAALLEGHGYEPWVLSMESQDGLDHCLYIYEKKGRWGSIGKSRDRGLGGRPPRYRNLKDLVWSYFDPYVDRTGRITAWQVAHLDEVGCDWRRSPRNVWFLENHLLEIKHHRLHASERRYQKQLKRYLAKGDLPQHKHWR